MNLAELFAGGSESSVALVHGDERVTYRDLAAAVDRAQRALLLRCDPGSTIALVGQSSIDFVTMVIASVRAGLPLLPLHPRNPAAELRNALDLASPTLVVSTDELSAALVADLGVTSCASSELIGSEGAGGTSDSVDPVAVEPDDPALLMFTSGTAGDPRVAVLSHANVVAGIEQSVQSAEILSERPHVTMGVMPLTHVLGLVSVIGVSLRVGATVVLSTDVAVDGVVAEVQRTGVTLLVAPPVFWFRLSQSDADPSTLASVQVALSGAAPLSGSVARSIAERFGLDLRQGYGLTEASPGLTSAVGTQAPATSVGRPLPGVELRLVDEFGDEALLGDVGEVWARGPNIFVGYLGDADATAQVVDRDGWLHTGDLAVVDERGHLFIVGRSKDQIIVGGFNVHPGEVEDLLATSADVESAAVVGEPDREYGEVVVAFVVATAGHTPDFAALAELCRSRLAGYKCPARYELVDELPRGSTGKIRRRSLRAD